MAVVLIERYSAEFFVQIIHKTVKRNTLTHLVNSEKLD